MSLNANNHFRSDLRFIRNLLALLFFIVVGEKLWHQPSLSDPRFAEYVANPDTYFIVNYGVSYEAQRLLSNALQWNPLGRIDLLEFRNQLVLLPRFFVSREEAALRFIRLRTNVAFKTIDINEAHKAFKLFFLRRSEKLHEAFTQDRTVVGSSNNARQPYSSTLPSTRSPALRDVYTYADSLRVLRQPYVDYGSALPSLPSLLPTSSHFGSQRSFESTLLQTPPLNRPFSLADVELTVSGENGRIAGSNGAPASPSDAYGEIKAPPFSGKAKMKHILSGVSGVFRFSNRR